MHHMHIPTKSCMKANEVKTLQCPCRSPDLNLMEDLWGILAQDVHKNGRLYRSKSDIKAAIKNCWNNIDTDTFDALPGSMNRRLMQTLEKRCSHITY
ncbi:hypothetical protein AVEN_96146-1 [Araneus ventricosus]|uniref:Tc1-like transposase DDE domain-containing protein n=1 Tax=Araneus ventricosus TaxID=182803 RepID=A0A4Y2HS20_ARAVE|nr:hypothetical protein AVEN_96146-1 [Araneus ventricosus]